MVTVSVVISTFNRRRLLEEAVASVCAQTISSWELLVVDDASGDDTWSWLSTLHDRRIRAFRQAANQERSVARNRGLAEASGPYVMFLDDDDRLVPQALETLVDALQKHPTAIAAVGARWKFRSGVYGVRIPHVRFGSCRIVWPELLAGWSSGSGQNLFRADVVREVGGFAPGLSLCEDRRLWLDVARHGPAALVPETVLEHRDHDGQLKPVRVREQREVVYQRALAMLPRAEHERGLLAHHAGVLADRAGDAYRDGESLVAARFYVRAMRTAPALAASPLTGALWSRGLAKAIVAPVWRPRPLG